MYQYNSYYTKLIIRHRCIEEEYLRRIILIYLAAAFLYAFTF